MAKNDNLSQWSLTLLRIVLGVLFTYHGYMKLFATGGFTGTIGFMTALGFPMPTAFALIVSAVEFFGGLFLLIGTITKLSSLLLLIEMLVAFFKVHLKNGFFISPTAYGYEFVIVLIAALVVVLSSGAGKLSLGSFFKNKYLK